MPTRDIEKQRLYRRRWYQKNKALQMARQLQRKHEHRDWIRSLRICCNLCPEDHPACLVFHHRDPSKKEISLASIVSRGWSKERIMKEIEKCDVLCSNCHLKTHWNMPIGVSAG